MTDQQQQSIDTERLPEARSPFAPRRRVSQPAGTSALAAPPSCSPIDDIAALVGALTYGEMLEFAEALAGGGEITRDALPGRLHAWATRAS